MDALRRRERTRPAPRPSADQKGEVETVFTEGLGERFGGAGDDFEAGRRVRKPIESGRQARGELARHADPEPRRRRFSSRGFVEHLVVQLEEPFAVVEADGSNARQFEARDLLEQRRLDQFLQPLHLQADGRLRPPKVFRCAGEAARVDDGDESSNDVDRNAAHLFPVQLS
jgi:hypothetical protein